eukprot:Nitzschia sp. Nitz4//scaffold172_size47551//6843//8867//NITZ4_007139-RA/size47551-processed-gene-0.15-mRNA-1//1//CDS//3329538744//1342//frame0
MKSHHGSKILLLASNRLSSLTATGLSRGARALSTKTSVQVDNSSSLDGLSRREIPKDGLTLDDFVQGNNIHNGGSRRSSSEASYPSPSAPKLPNNGRTFHIQTYGCQMNVSDSDIVRAVLLNHGYTESQDQDAADVLLTNTCAIREKAEQKVWQRLRTLRKRKKSKNGNSDRVVGLLGCMAERLQEELLRDQMADVVVGPDAYRDLPNLLDAVMGSVNDADGTDPIERASTAMNVQLSTEETYQDIVPVRDSLSPVPFSAFCSIQRGCSNRCSFCIVPFTRGQERSRPLETIVAEVEQLVAEQQLKEVVLLGQNVNSYHDRSEAAMAAQPLANTPGLSNAGFRNRIRRPTQGGYTFVDLVERIANISPELRVRFTSPHPKDYPTELLHCMAERPNVCEQLHLPAQSGATTMLKRMKRGYSREAYLELIDNVRTILPDVALSSDFIAGFCGETDAEHEDTVSLLQQVEYEQAYLFAYSMREKTLAHRTMVDDVDPKVKQVRLQELIDTFRSHVQHKNVRVELGKLRLVLVEGPAKRQLQTTDEQDEDATVAESTWHGRTDQNKRIMFQVQQDIVSDENAPPTVRVADKEAALSVASQVSTWTPDQIIASAASSTPDKTSCLIPGDYAVVEVTEIKGHTLRGRVLWKTSLGDFAEMETSVFSQWNPEQLDAFKRQF